MAANGYPIVSGKHIAPKHTVITDLFQVSSWPLIRVFKINNPFNYFISDYHIQTNQLLGTDISLIRKGVLGAAMQSIDNSVSHPLYHLSSQLVSWLSF